MWNTVRFCSREREGERKKEERKGSAGELGGERGSGGPTDRKTDRRTVRESKSESARQNDAPSRVSPIVHPCGQRQRQTARNTGGDRNTNTDRDSHTHRQTGMPEWQPASHSEAEYHRPSPNATGPARQAGRERERQTDRQVRREGHVRSKGLRTRSPRGHGTSRSNCARRSGMGDGRSMGGPGSAGGGMCAARRHPSGCVAPRDAEPRAPMGGSRMRTRGAYMI